MSKTIASRLFSDIIEDQYFNNLLKKCCSARALLNLKISTNLKLSESETIDLLRYADILSCIDDDDSTNLCLNIISFLEPFIGNNEIFNLQSKAIFSKLGNFLSITLLSNNTGRQPNLPLDRQIEAELKKIIQKVPFKKDIYFTNTQYSLYRELVNKKCYSFSAPTSMGKSFIIQSFVKKALTNKPPENVIIMVPSRALISQYYRELFSELNKLLVKYNFKIITSSNIENYIDTKNGNYIFILTPERIISLLNNSRNLSIGFLFVDEAHKLAAKSDNRSITGYFAIENALKKFPNLNIYFTSPNIKNPEIFLSLFRKDSSHVFSTTSSPVGKQIFFMDMINGDAFLIQNKYKYKLCSNLNKIFPSTNNMLATLGANTNNIIYYNSKMKAAEKALDLYNYLLNNNPQTSNDDDILTCKKQLMDHVHKDFYLVDFIEHGIAFHSGQLPQLVRNIVENLFQKKKIAFLFCTSTLLEGVNLPAKNIFIFENKKGRGNAVLSPIDFWNLAGRAGRFGQELCGNVFCVKCEDKMWRDIDILNSEMQTTIKPTIQAEIEKKLKRIEKILKSQDISGTETEKEILRYIANIICLDTLEIDFGYRSPIIESLISKNKKTILTLAAKKTKNLSISRDILRAHQSIDISTQNKVYCYLKQKNKLGQDIRFPSSVNKTTSMEVMTSLFDLYDWHTNEHRFFSTKDQNKQKASLKYFSLILRKWANSQPLSSIINEAIEFNQTHKRQIKIAYDKFEEFNPNNKLHVNILITNIFEDIENRLRFVSQKYFSHYYHCVAALLGENNAGANWAQFVEYGTQNKIAITLQNLGLTRHTSINIVKKNRECLTIHEGNLVEINYKKLLSTLDKHSIEYLEISQLTH